MSPSKVESKPQFPADADSESYAQQLDSQDHLRSFRDKFIIPSKANLRSKSLAKPGLSPEDGIYFCGNSLGLQPKAVSKYIEAQLDTWSGIGVYGHFTQLEESPLKPWQLMAETAAEQSARIVGAKPEEVAIMNTLTVNLHMLMASFYKPAGQRTKILLEWKAFPSDHYAIESQLQTRGMDPKEHMILLEPDNDHIISTDKILRAIDEHADEIALILLPGIQYYSGQYFDMPTITAHAKSKGLTIGWDLAHAAGNVPVQLHDWDVDFAAWCTYKYQNAGPGSIAGCFVHEKHGKVEFGSDGQPIFRPRLTGWYGGDRAVRFKMDNKFRPIPGAGGFQCSNPSAIDLTSLCAALSVWDETSIHEVRAKSLQLTAYAEHLLMKGLPADENARPYRIITPLDPRQRGAQLSVLLAPGLLKTVAKALQEAGIVADSREPDVVRVAPVPLYNTYSDVYAFVATLRGAIGV
ncbi:Kynureninase (L-kynurenine hydrolase) [Diplodia intermedia]|uniref:Kynureninase n=1 Tax=Diplodia intermedia TaxID=856260 RepID=A0ABR3U5S3_9PEZI